MSSLPLGLGLFSFSTPTLIELHRAAAHFPIALLLSSVFCEILAAFWKKEGLRETAFWTHLLGTASAAVTVALGWFGNPFRGKTSEIAQMATVHQWWGIATLVLFAGLALWRLKRRDRLGRGERLFYAAATFLGVVVVSVTGYLGGRLVG